MIDRRAGKAGAQEEHRARLGDRLAGLGFTRVGLAHDGVAGVTWLHRLAWGSASVGGSWVVVVGLSRRHQARTVIGACYASDQNKDEEGAWDSE